jgi:quercetin dioxygenase-like cupin family protein
MKALNYVDWTQVEAREIFPGVFAQVAYGEKIMLSRVAFTPNLDVPLHDHPHEQFGFVESGEATFIIGGDERLLRAGDYYAIPGGISHEVHAGPDGAVCMDIFSPPREEYK